MIRFLNSEISYGTLLVVVEEKSDEKNNYALKMIKK